MQDNGDEFHDKDPPSLRIHVDRTMVYLLRMLEESGVTRRRALRAFGCLLYMRLMSARRECDGGNRRRETVCVVAPRVVVGGGGGDDDDDDDDDNARNTERSGHEGS